MKAKLELKGLEQWLEALAAAGADVDQAADQTLSAGADLALTGMKRRAPKDTHNLEQHIVASIPKVEGNQHIVKIGLIGADADTARYGNAQEYGWNSKSGHRAGTPYIRPTMDEDRKAIVAAMKASLKASGKA